MRYQKAVRTARGMARNCGILEEHTGLEPARSDWKSEMLPLHQCSMCEANHVRAVCFAVLSLQQSDCAPHARKERSGLMEVPVVEQTGLEPVAFFAPRCSPY